MNTNSCPKTFNKSSHWVHILSHKIKILQTRKTRQINLFNAILKHASSINQSINQFIVTWLQLEGSCTVRQNNKNISELWHLCIRTSTRLVVLLFLALYVKTMLCQTYRFILVSLFNPIPYPLMILYMTLLTFKTAASPYCKSIAS